ncbi:MAG: hypothetical protein PHV83_04005 [Bacteroidales bacterium]|nr:hypothetical protein [Bacteroidales bacterium]
MDLTLTTSRQISQLQESCDIRYGCEVSLVYTEKTRSVTIDSFRSKIKNVGNGTDCMRYLLSVFADLCINTIHLNASPLGGMDAKTRQLETLRLCNWYSRFGFDVVKYNYCGEYIANAEMVKVFKYE